MSSEQPAEQRWIERLKLLEKRAYVVQLVLAGRLDKQLDDLVRWRSPAEREGG